RRLSGHSPARGRPAPPLRQRGRHCAHTESRNRAIEFLEDPVPPSDFSMLQAVRWLVYLVGDLHQPLHVTTGYYNTTLNGFPKKLWHPAPQAVRVRVWHIMSGARGAPPAGRRSSEVGGA